MKCFKAFCSNKNYRNLFAQCNLYEDFFSECVLLLYKEKNCADFERANYIFKEQTLQNSECLKHDLNLATSRTLMSAYKNQGDIRFGNCLLKS